eukprot:Skav209614  [mRNA]  locus=scaffold1634:554498:555137:- [translate_table: standard]
MIDDVVRFTGFHGRKFVQAELFDGHQLLGFAAEEELEQREAGGAQSTENCVGAILGRRLHIKSTMGSIAQIIQAAGSQPACWAEIFHQWIFQGKARNDRRRAEKNRALHGFSGNGVA